MSKDRESETVSQGGASKPTEAERDGEFDVREKGGDPSPGDRDRGETSSAGDEAPIDLDTVRDRAS